MWNVLEITSQDQMFPKSDSQNLKLMVNIDFLEHCQWQRAIPDRSIILKLYQINRLWEYVIN
jgi:hypothetical protein